MAATGSPELPEPTISFNVTSSAFHRMPVFGRPTERKFTRGRGHYLKRRDLINGIDVIDAFALVLIALMRGIYSYIAGL